MDTKTAEGYVGNYARVRTLGPHAAQEVIDALGAEVERLREEINFRIAVSDTFYDEIRRAVGSFYPHDTRDLDWDVLPSSMGKLAADVVRLRGLCRDVAAGLTSNDPSVPFVLARLNQATLEAVKKEAGR